MVHQGGDVLYCCFSRLRLPGRGGWTRSRELTILWFRHRRKQSMRFAIIARCRMLDYDMNSLDRMSNSNYIIIFASIRYSGNGL
jgi:hypothetical protein